MQPGIQIDPALMGKKFTTNGLTTNEYTCVGFGQNETFIVFGAYNDTLNNRFTVKSFKLTEAQFIGTMP